MKYKALLSDKQFFSVRGQRYKATQGIFITEDKVVIEALDARPDAWEKIVEAVEVKKKPKKDGKK